jgi:hypothetical protein
VFERLRLADATEWVAIHFLNEPVDALEHLAILLLPEKVVLPRLIGE